MSRKIRKLNLTDTQFVSRPSDIRHKNLLKHIKGVKTVSSRKTVFYHAGAWPVSSEAGQRPAQKAHVFIWDRDHIAPGFVVAPVSGLSHAIN